MNALTQNKKQIKSGLVKAPLVCLATAGALGIVALLTGGFGELEGKILASTVLIGIFSMLSLCYLAVAGKPYQWVGLPGVVAAAAFLMLGLFILWVWPDSPYSGEWELFQEIIKYFFISAILAVTFAHASLLLLLSGSLSKHVRIGLAATLASIGFVAATLVLLIAYEFHLADVYVRWLGVFAILDVVGSIATPVLARLGKKA